MLSDSSQQTYLVLVITAVVFALWLFLGRTISRFFGDQSGLLFPRITLWLAMVISGGAICYLLGQVATPLNANRSSGLLRYSNCAGQCLLLPGNVPEESLREIEKNSDKFRGVKSVEISGPQATDDMLYYIGFLPDLEYLTLKSVRIRGSGFINLQRAVKLNNISLYGTWVSDIWITKLASLPNLRNLQIDSSDVTERGLEALLNLKPNLRVDAPALRNFIARKMSVKPDTDDLFNVPLKQDDTIQCSMEVRTPDNRPDLLNSQNGYDIISPYYDGGNCKYIARAQRVQPKVSTGGTTANVQFKCELDTFLTVKEIARKLKKAFCIVPSDPAVPPRDLAKHLTPFNAPCRCPIL